MGQTTRLQFQFPPITIREEDFPDEKTFVGVNNVVRSLREALNRIVSVVNNNIAPSGTTANRPVITVQTRLEQGQPYYDTTLKKPIWYEPSSVTKWVDATGAAV